MSLGWAIAIVIGGLALLVLLVLATVVSRVPDWTIQDEEQRRRDAWDREL